MAERTKILGVAAKIQTVEGTDSVPTFAANAVRPIGIPVLQINHLEEGDRTDEQHGGMGDIGEAAAAGRWGQIDITLAIKGGGGDYQPGVIKPEWDPFLRAAGFSAVVSGVLGSGVITYTDLDTGTFERLSLYLQAANKLFKMIDCVCLPKMSADAAKRGTFTFTCIGRIVSDVTENAMGAQTLNSVAPPLFHSNTMTVGAFSSAGNPPLVCRKVDLDMGTAYTPRPGAGQTDGLAGFEITDRQPTFSSEIEVVPLATWDPYTLARQAQQNGVGTDTKVTFKFGSVAFNRVTFNLGLWAFRSPPQGDNSGLATYNLAGKILARSLASGRMISIVAD